MAKRTKEKHSYKNKPKGEKKKKDKKRRKVAKHSINPSKKEKKACKKENNNTFNFDNEIVIGINVIPDSKEKKKKKKNNTNIKRKTITVKDEIQDKPKKKSTKKTRAAKVIVILILFIGVGIFLITSPLFNISKIDVIGNSKMSEEQIISLSQVKMDTNIYKVINSKVEENIKQDPYIENVTVSKKLPNEIEIKVLERKPQYFLQFGNGYAYINSQGYILEISDEKINAVLLTGYSTEEEQLKPGNRLNEKDLKKLENVLKIMESATTNEIAKYISEIDISDENNYTLFLESQDKIAYLGNASNISDKIIVLKQMIIKSEGVKGEAFLKDKDKMYFREE